MRRWVILAAAALVVMALPGVAAADHPSGGSPFETETSSGLVEMQGPEEAEWEMIRSFFAPLGLGFTDIDFFTQGGEMYVSAGTLATGLNGGQTILRLTQDGEVDPEFVSAHPSASCISDPGAALGLQHDVEATPKGDVLFNVDWGGAADTRDAQLLIDATDAGGRCHDHGPFGLFDNPQGGLEIVDITDIENPVEIALTSHIGEAHTVNVDPTRPHIAYAVTSDGVGVEEDNGELVRANEDPDGEPLDLDGFEVVDLSSCMDFPAGTSVEEKRGIDTDAEDLTFLEDEGCRPEVYRYRFELGWTQGTFNWESQTGCHELELHPGDILTCAAPDGTLLLDMSGAFDADGTPRGEPLPCDIRESNSDDTPTAAPIIDCVIGEDEADLTVPGWLDMGAPSLAGVQMIGFVNHGGRDEGNNASHSPEEDIAVSHEAELTHSGRFVFASDERGGAVVPPDASCPIPGQQPEAGNGGLHAFRVDRLHTSYPGDPLEEDAETIAQRAYSAYALNPDGEKAIYRATPRIPAETLCTAHVFQQIPGQNRIFMGWYTQGTQVVDYVEHDDGSFEWHEAGWFIPDNANQWVSHVFRFEESDDGSFTYWGVAADFKISEHGRNAVDVWTVTMPAPPEAAAPQPEQPEDEEEPAPEPEDEEEPLPSTGGGAMAIVPIALLAAAAAVTLRRRRLTG